MKFAHIALATALSTLPFTAFAQTEETPTPETTVQAPAPANPLASDATSFPVAADVQDGAIYVREKHGDWEVRCVKGKETGCNVYQLLKGTEGNSIAEFNMEALPKGGQAAGGVTLITPLGTLLPAQATLRVDANPAKRYPYSWCEQAGCISRFGLTDAEIAGMKKGANAKIAIVSVVDPEKPIDLNLSLTGFTAAWDSIAPK